MLRHSITSIQQRLLRYGDSVRKPLKAGVFQLFKKNSMRIVVVSDASLISLDTMVSVVVSDAFLHPTCPGLCARSRAGLAAGS